MEHTEILKDIWNSTVSPGDTDEFQISDQLWRTKLGFQSANPLTDFRGGGLLSLEVLHHFCNSSLGQKLLTTCQERRAKAIRVNDDLGLPVFTSYPIAPAIIGMVRYVSFLFKICTEHGIKTKLEDIGESEMFRLLLLDHDNEKNVLEGDEIFQSSFSSVGLDNNFSSWVVEGMIILDQVWIEMEATYMEFPTVMTETKELLRERMVTRGREIVDMENEGRE